jgi:hypothetical protein
MAERLLVRLPPLAGRQAESWSALVELAPTLGEHWLLVGGQMVFLHEVQRRAREVRPTDDIDVVVDLRVQPTGLVAIHRRLEAAGFAQDVPSAEGIAHRYRRAGAVIDVLAPDNIGARARLALGRGRTLSAPGTTQAFQRSQWVDVELADGTGVAVRLPSIVGALLGKAAAVHEISSQTAAARAKHRRDLDSLATLLGVGDRRSAALSRSERRTIAALVDDTRLTALARASLRRLLEPPPAEHPAR